MVGVLRATVSSERLACLALVGAAAFSVAGLAGPSRARAVELEGTWHILVHYRDASSARPEALRWEDRVWVFERRGSRLRWTDYPIVVLGDSEGRFENLGTNRATRVVHAWEPSEAQRAIIDGGPPVNTLGSKSKSLRPDERGGWSSGGRVTVRSATSLGYHETWSIEDVAGMPVFQRLDSLSGARASGPRADGVTRFGTASVSEDGNELRGDYQRDQLRTGTFRMRRTPPIQPLEQKATPGERLREHLSDQFLGLGLGRAPRESEAEGREGEAE
ncbi:MAG: hypothetical protein ACQGVK_14080 [Myxococcota bacterium]